MAKNHTSPSTPRYRRQKRPNGQDLAFVALGHRRIYLGRYGSLESRREYHRVLAEWMARDRRAPVRAQDITIVELINEFWQWAQQHYRRADGTVSQEASNHRSVLRMLKKLYAHTPVNEFTPMALKAVRGKMIEAGWTRRSINRQVVRLRSVFKWGVSEGLVPVEIHTALGSVPGLQAGRGEAKEPSPVNALTDDAILAVIPHVPEIIADMLRVQLWTAMRPGELCTMRPVDIDMSESIWLYRPQEHKTTHHGRERTIHIGPKSQAVIREYLRARPIDSYLFSPAESERLRRAKWHGQRKAPLSCGNKPGSNRNVKPKRSPRERYDKNTYAQAIRRGCDRAFPPPASATITETIQWRKEHRWSPNQLRHTAATMIRREAGLETTRTVLGHSTAAVTEKFYAEADAEKARQIIAKLGWWSRRPYICSVCRPGRLW